MKDRNDLEPELLFDILDGLQKTGHRDIAKALAKDTLNQIPDTKLPWHKAVRGRAYAVLGQRELAKQTWLRHQY